MAFLFPASPAEGATYLAPNSATYIFSSGKWVGNYVPVVGPAGPTGPAGASSGLGIGQTWTDMTASRALGTTYSNLTGKPIVLNITSVCSGGGSGSYIVTVNGAVAGRVSPIEYQGGGGTYTGADSFIIPAGATYKLDFSGFGSISISLWMELR